MNTITPQKAFDMIKEGALLLDIRTPAEFRSVHAENAQCYPLDMIQSNVQGIVPFIEKSSHVILICQSGSRAQGAFKILRNQFNVRFLVVEGGTNAWIDSNLPVKRGKGAISIERQVRICAGSLIVIGCILAVLISKWFIVIPALIGAGLLNAGISNRCGMGLLLAKMPWNK